jgi:hypothetical protein
MPPPRPSWQVYKASQWVVSTPAYVVCVEHINITPQEMRIFYALKSFNRNDVYIDVVSTADIRESLVITDQKLGMLDEWEVGVLHALHPSNIVQFIILHASSALRVDEVILLEQVRKQAHRSTTWLHFNPNRPMTADVTWYGPVTDEQAAYFAKGGKKIYIQMKDGLTVEIITENEYNEYIVSR